MLQKNNSVWLKVFINVHLSVCQIGKQTSRRTSSCRYVNRKEGLLSSFCCEDKHIVQLLLLLPYGLFEGEVVHVSASH